ncbi:MAG: F0F1 ATP synthase subunit A [Streptosporangiaceae bacterium]
MSDVRMLTTASGCHLFSGCGYPAPSFTDFLFKPLFKIGIFEVTKPIVLVLLVAVIVLLFFGIAFRKPKMVPRGAQNLGEMAILLVRDQILRPQLGKRGDRYLPFLVSLFFFIWLMNLLELIPPILFPATSLYGIPVGLTLIVWLTYLAIGMKHQGPIGYFKNMAVPAGAPWWILPLLSPIELLSNIIVRPFTLSIRLMANMLSGHLLLLVFGLATWYLFGLSIGLLFSATSLIVYLLVSALEVLITLLQAFIFTTLTAFYISDALESAH